MHWSCDCDADCIETRLIVIRPPDNIYFISIAADVAKCATGIYVRFVYCRYCVHRTSTYASSIRFPNGSIPFDDAVFIRVAVYTNKIPADIYV